MNQSSVCHPLPPSPVYTLNLRTLEKALLLRLSGGFLRANAPCLIFRWWHRTSSHLNVTRDLEAVPKEYPFPKVTPSQKGRLWASLQGRCILSVNVTSRRNLLKGIFFWDCLLLLHQRPTFFKSHCGLSFKAGQQQRLLGWHSMEWHECYARI